MNILHVITGRGPTGPAAAAMNDVRALLAAGHQAWIASRSGTGLDEACAAGKVPYLGGLKLGRGAMRLLRLPHDVSVLRELVRAHKIDLVHVHRSDDQLLAASALRGKTIPIVRTWHRPPTRLPRPLLRQLLSPLAGCVCVAAEHQDALGKLLNKPCTQIPGAVDTAIFTPRARGTNEAAPQLGHVGRWKRERDGSDRGQLQALQIFAALPQQTSWRATLIGRGEQGDTLRDQAYKTLRLPPERVQFQDVLKASLPEFAAALSALDLGLVFCTGGDGTSRAALELLASGVPLLVADLPGLRELADASGCVKVLPAAGTAEWVAEISALLKSPESLRALSAAARQRAERVHTYAQRGAALAQFYAALK